MRTTRPALLAALLAGLVPLPGRADAPFFLKGGERIVAFGDSITQAGFYLDYLEAYLLTRFPDRRFPIVNRGVSSETVSGTTEPDHSPRPNALDRFARDVVAAKPDVVIACFGMNDGNYHPFDEGRFARYQAGIRSLVARTRDEAKARLVLLTPPPFDPYRRTVGDPSARTFGYSFPAIDYDQTLDRYSRWLVTLGGEGLVVDVHAATNDHLRRRREGQVSFFLAGDGVHPNATGHWLIAQSLLLAWRAPALVAEARVDAATVRAESGDLAGLERNGGGLRFVWRSPLPMPIDPAWDRRSLELERVADCLNRYRLAVTHLAASRYRLFARLADDPQETDLGVFDRDRLSEGIDLTALDDFPTVALARRLLGSIQQHRRAAYDRWRRQIAGPSESPSTPADPDDPAWLRIRQSCRTREVLVRLMPVDVR